MRVSLLATTADARHILRPQPATACKNAKSISCAINISAHAVRIHHALCNSSWRVRILVRVGLSTSRDRVRILAISNGTDRGRPQACRRPRCGSNANAECVRAIGRRRTTLVAQTQERTLGNTYNGAAQVHAGEQGSNRWGQAVCPASGRTRKFLDIA